MYKQVRSTKKKWSRRKQNTKEKFQVTVAVGLKKLLRASTIFQSWFVTDLGSN